MAKWDWVLVWHSQMKFSNITNKWRSESGYTPRNGINVRTQMRLEIAPLVRSTVRKIEGVLINGAFTSESRPMLDGDYNPQTGWAIELYAWPNREQPGWPWNTFEVEVELRENVPSSWPMVARIYEWRDLSQAMRQDLWEGSIYDDAKTLPAHERR